MSKSEPYRETSNVPVYFEPRIENISYDEYNVEAPTAADCARSYAASATVYETKDKAFKDF